MCLILQRKMAAETNQAFEEIPWGEKKRWKCVEQPETPRLIQTKPQKAWRDERFTRKEEGILEVKTGSRAQGTDINCSV